MSHTTHTSILLASSVSTRQLIIYSHGDDTDTDTTLSTHNSHTSRDVSTRARAGNGSRTCARPQRRSIWPPLFLLFPTELNHIDRRWCHASKMACRHKPFRTRWLDARGWYHNDLCQNRNAWGRAMKAIAWLTDSSPNSLLHTPSVYKRVYEFGVFKKNKLFILER
jgi:hypothetical protein